jgi:hypothetical protein
MLLSFWELHNLRFGQGRDFLAGFYAAFTMHDFSENCLT